jgi:hypothetical protein
MGRSFGLDRRAYHLDAESVLVGYVGANGYSRAEETRTGAARLLTTQLNQQNLFKLVVVGQDAAAAGQYTIQVAHVPAGGTLADASAYASIATVTLAGKGTTEIGLSGRQLEDAIKAADAGVTGEVRGVAIQAVAGTGEAEPAGTATIYIQPA